VPRLTEIGTPQLEAIAIGAQLQFRTIDWHRLVDGTQFSGQAWQIL
jgi:hypothetical protein